jgi:hypothetical protein
VEVRLFKNQDKKVAACLSSDLGMTVQTTRGGITWGGLMNGRTLDSIRMIGRTKKGGQFDSSQNQKF